MKKFLMTLLISFIVGITINAQIVNEISEREIKLSGKYYWGEGIRDSLQNAKEDAVMDIQYKISVTLKSASESKITEKDAKITSSFSKNIKMFSTIKLKGLEFFSKKRSDGKILTDAYISKKNYNKMVEELKNDISDRVKLAETMEGEKGIVDAVPMYYKAYLYTYFCPDPVPYNSITYKQKYHNVRFFLDTKIRSFLAELEILQDSITVDPSTPELITVNLNVNYLKLDVDNVDLSFNLPGNPKQRVEQGKAKLFLYTQPSSMREEYEINLNVDFNDSSELSDFNDNFPIREKQKMLLDFTSLVKIDFRDTLLADGSLQFEPVIRNLSVSSVQWDFGNGVLSTDLKTIYKFSDKSPHNVSLTVNGIKKMKVVKRINSVGKILEEESFDMSNPNSDISHVVKSLMDRKTFDTIIEELIKFKNEGKITFSLKSKDFFDIMKCYGIIVDRSSRKIISFISPGKKTRKDLLTNEEVPNYKIKFKGKGIIWFQVN